MSVNITPAARDELRAATLALTTPAGRRVSMSDVLIAAFHVALRRQDEVIGELRGES